MSAENDRPSADDGGRNDGMRGKSTVGDVDGHGECIVMESECDVHSCGRCKLQFSSIDDFIKHKLQHGDCRLQYKRSGHLKLPKLIKKGTGSAADSSSLKDYKQDVPLGKRGRGRPRKVRGSNASGLFSQPSREGGSPLQEDLSVSAATAAADVALPEHRCSSCSTSFHRKAALKCHLLQEHGVGSNAGSDVDEDDGSTNGYDSADNEWLEGASPDPSSHRLRVADAVSGGAALASAGNYQSGGHQTRKRRAQSCVAIENGLHAAPYACEKCSKTFSNVETLRAHLATHRDDRTYPCTVDDCQFAFKTKGSLKRHLRRHTDERPYKCNECGRAFRESGALTRHLKSRTPCMNKSDSDLPRYGKSLSLTQGAGLASFASDVTTGSQLPLSFAQAKNATIGVAGGESAMRSSASVGGSLPETTEDVIVSDFQKCCQVCNMAFNGMEQLMEHLRSHLIHQQHQQPVQCGLCGHTSATGDALDEHVAQQHSQELDSKVVDENLNPASTLMDVTVETSDNDMIATITFNTPSTLANECHRQEEGEDTGGDKETGIQNVDIDDEASASSAHGSFATMSDSDKGSVVVVKLREDGGVGGGSLDAADDADGDDDTVHHSGDDQDAAHEKRVRDSTVAVHQLLQLSTLLAASSAAAAAAGSTESPLEGTNGDPDSSSGQMAKMAVALAHRTCPVCKRTFKAGSYLRLHMRSHTGERPHKCPHCPKDFATRDTYNKHLLAHSDERQYKCGECGKLFKRISHVKEHLKIHSNERPYPCTACDKTFKTANAWKVHMRTHSQVMGWQCHQCPRQFREKSSLIRHARTHTGERPYPCRFCGRLFSEHGTLNRHLRAKVPCTSQLSQLRMMQQNLCDGAVVNLAVSTSANSQDGFPTVLTEFSSVVADTQQYITPNSTASIKALEQCIVVEQGAALDGLRIVSKPEGNLGNRSSDGSSLPTFYVVRTGNSNLRVHLSCDDELFQQSGPFDSSDTVVMLQNPMSGAEEANCIANDSNTPSESCVVLPEVSNCTDAADMLESMPDDDSNIIVSSASH